MCHIQDESKEEIAYAQDMFETIFKDYALKTYNKDVGEKAAEYVAQGVTYDQYYAAYFAARGITGDKDENGKTITNSASRKKKEAIDKASDMKAYTGISADKGQDYDVVLGVINEDVYYMLHITKATVATDATVGTTIEITGQYKH